MPLGSQVCSLGSSGWITTDATGLCCKGLSLWLPLTPGMLTTCSLIRAELGNQHEIQRTWDINVNFLCLQPGVVSVFYRQR